ncbi:MAG: hypothetical protein LBD06_07180 [Candidatus Accumulibacter sp.]|jgi:hypothetical protein|nr:hypothetical protein [Accumulibacter sp.]
MHETSRSGHLAQTFADCELPLEVLESAAGFYIGTFHPKEGPFSRESEYFPTEEAAREALENGAWTQRLNP